MNTAQEDIQTLPAAQEQEMRAMQNLFQRAANVIVDASKLGEEVKQLREQLKTLLADTERMREHISWLEQENAALRTQRDEAQNALSNTRADIDNHRMQINSLEHNLGIATNDRDNAKGEAKLWQEEATKLENERNGLVTERDYLKGMLTTIWDNIRDHFTPKPVAAEPIRTDTEQGYKPMEGTSSGNSGDYQGPMPEHKPSAYSQYHS